MIKSDNSTRCNREKSNIASQYWKNEWLDGNIIISYFGGSDNIFADCMWQVHIDPYYNLQMFAEYIFYQYQDLEYILAIV